MLFAVGSIGLRRSLAGKHGGATLFDGRILDHRLAAAGAKDEAFEKRIASEAVCAVNAGIGRFSGGIETRNGSAAPEIGFDAAHHVMCCRADGGDVRCEVKAVLEAGGIDS